MVVELFRQILHYWLQLLAKKDVQKERTGKDMEQGKNSKYRPKGKGSPFTEKEFSLKGGSLFSGEFQQFT